MLRCINLVLQWKVKTIHLQMDSACVHHWLLDTLSGQTSMSTKAPAEMLFRHWLTTERTGCRIWAGYWCVVKSYDNQADQLTRVPWQWLEEICTVVEPKETGCAVVEELDVAHIQAIHQRTPWHEANAIFCEVGQPKAPKGSSTSGS